ncbi:unnamed protein product [Allacma fusca]|uniref:Uncharacterized protein n=1 Tax=Allacma fusca TaxID=39272 RepID=A0A8J2JJ63_9HEXA|nr:unnamed protein product [Allacma fusca]
MRLTIIGPTPGNYSPPTEEEDASVLKARLDAECQQLARDLQAAVQELVRPELSLGRARAMDEHHDYSEIYTPSSEKVDGLHLGLSQPPPPPMHRFPSWESRIYEVAAGGLKVPLKEDTSSSVEIASTTSRHGSFHSLGINFSIPVYTTVKGRASQIRSAPFSGDSSDSSDGEEMGSGSGGSGPSHPISSGETDISSPGKSAASSIANSLSPLHRSSSSPSKSLRRGQ